MTNHYDQALKQVLGKFEKAWREFEITNAYEFPKQKKSIQSFLTQSAEKIKGAVERDVAKEMTPEEALQFLRSSGYDSLAEALNKAIKRGEEKK